VEVAHPRNRGAVVETECELHPHLHAATDSLDDADDVRLRLARGHEVDEPHGPFRGLEGRLEDERGVRVTTPGRTELSGRLDRPEPVLGVAAQAAALRGRAAA